MAALISVLSCYVCPDMAFLQQKRMKIDIKIIVDCRDRTLNVSPSLKYNAVCVHNPLLVCL